MHNNINVNVSGPIQPSSQYKTVVLKGNLPFASQVTEPNTKYVIKHNFVLDGDVTIPDNCILEFDGGSLSNASGNSYTLTGNNTVIDSPYTDDYIQYIELLGTFDIKERRKNIYIIDNKTFGITEGYFEKDANGHYSQEQYDKMYNNGVGFTNALNYARDKKYSGVVFEKGTYCFCPFGSTVATYYGSIQVQDFEHFDINLNGSELRLLIDSSTKSPYITYNPSSVWFIKHCIFRLFACNHVSIHNGTLIGDKLERSFTDTSEVWEELTYGIMVGGCCFYTSIYDIDASYFMGDAFDVHGVLTPMVSYTSEGFGAYGGGADVGKVYKGGYKSNNNVITESDDSGKAMTGYIDFSSSRYVNTMNFKVVNDVINRRVYSINNQGGYNRAINAYQDKIIIVTFASENGDPIRYIPCAYLENFELEEGENGIRIITLYNYDITEDGIDPHLKISAVSPYNILIKDCEIRNNHRGGISGGCNDITVESCVFYKSLINPFPDPTDYCINFEDTQGNYLLVHNCDFSSAKSVKDKTRNQGRIIYSGKKLVVANCTLCESPIITHAIYADIYGCTIQNGVPNGGDFYLDYERHNNWVITESARYNKRVIYVHNNKIIQGSIPTTGKNTIIDIFDNVIHIAGVYGNFASIKEGTTIWHNNEIYGIKNSVADNYVRLLLPTLFYNNHVYNMQNNENEEPYPLEVSLFTFGTEVQNAYNYISDGVAIRTNASIEDNVMSAMHFLKGSGCYIELPTGDARKQNIRIENVIIENDVDEFVIRRNGITAEPTKDVDIVFRNCIFIKQIKLSANNTEHHIIHSLSFENCDFSEIASSGISNDLHDEYVTTGIIFKNCKFKDKQKLYDGDTSYIFNTKGTSTERPTQVNDGFVYIDTTLGKPIYKDVSSNTGWVDATGTSV